MNYFNKLPLITYDNNIAVNIMARAKLSDNIKSDRSALLPYTLEDGDRMDTVARAYYGNAGYSWLIWFSNETVDPYFDMPLGDLDFQEYMRTKYGSIELAQRKIAFYRTNGAVDDRKITTAQFNSFVNGEQKYWEPELDYLLNIKGYVRNTNPQTINTSRIASITFTQTGIQSGQFKVGEEIQQSGTVYGFATYVSNSQLTVQHVNGNYTVGATVTGRESGAKGTIVAANNTVATTQAFNDVTYWQPITFYDQEMEQNELKREIFLTDSRLKNQIEQDLKRAMDPS